MSQGITGTEPFLHSLLRALKSAEALPRRSTVVGGPDYLPREYQPGAPGWVDAVSEVVQTEDGGFAIPFPSSARKHLGRTLRDGTENVVVPDRTVKIKKKAPP